MHKEWCGKPCSECKDSCRLDEEIPCSPDCEFLGEDGSTMHPECQNCDAMQLYRVSINYDGVMYVRATSLEDARERVCAMRSNEMYEKSEGAWAIDNAEEAEE